MLSIKKMGRGSEDYYLDLADYYADGAGEPAGRWLGRGCPALGLWGEVAREELKPLMLGQHPHSQRPLVQNAGAANRVPGWDLTFSPPKGVSLVWSQADPQFRLRLEAAHARAVAQAVSLAEEELAYSRTGQGGSTCVPVQLVVAAFTHSTSRNLDPQLHTHCLVLNVAIDDAGQTRTLYSKPLFVNRNLLGAYYRAQLASELRQLGFHLRRHGTSFEIAGLPECLLSVQSSRRREILAQLSEEGRAGGKAAAVATLATRRAKVHIPSRDILFTTWQAENRQWGLYDVNDLLHPNEPQPPGTFAAAFAAALARLANEKSHFTKTDILATTLQESAVLGLAPDEVLRSTQERLERTHIIRTTTVATTLDITPAEPGLLDLGTHDGQQRFTTPEILAEEESLVAAADTLRSRAGASVPEHVIEWAIEEHMRELARKAAKKGQPLAEPPQPSAEQLAAIRHLLLEFSQTGSLKILRGLAGTGKTDYVLAIVVKALKACGYDVLAATPTAKAGRVLERDTGLDVETVTKMLGDYELPGGCLLVHHVRQLKRALLGQSTSPPHQPAPVTLTPQSVLLVDEASMLTTRHMQKLLVQAAEQGATVLLTGDPKQLPPVGRGAPLLSLAERMGAVDLTDIQRQRDAWSRQVAQHAAHGEVSQALTLLAQHNAIRAADTAEGAQQLAIQRWADLGGTRRPAEVALIAGTNAEVAALNARAQQHRLQQGVIGGGRSLVIRDEDTNTGAMHEARIYPGDQVLITRNDRQLKVANGMTGTVLNVNPVSGNVSLSLATGGIIIVPARSFPHLRLGYALTTHKVQGDTLRHAVTLVTEQQQSLPAFYVQTTRARESTTIVTTKALWNPEAQPIAKTPLAELLGRSPDLRLAIDLRDAAASVSPTPAMHPPLEIGSRPPAPPPEPPPASTPPQPVPAAASTPASPQPTFDPPPVERFVAVPVTEVMPPAPQKTSPVDEEPTASPPADSAPPDPSFVFPPPPKKRRKKKRPAGFGEADEADFDESEPTAPRPQAQAIEIDDTTPVESGPDGSAEPVPPVDPVLPEEFFLVPIPSVRDWRPDNTPVDPDAMLSQEFLRTYRPPTARHLPTRMRIPSTPSAPRDGSQDRFSVSADMVQDPAYRNRWRAERCQALMASAAAEHNVPPDQIEIIGIREWEENVSETQVRLWIEITIRIRGYGPRDLMQAVAFPVRV